MLTLSTLSRRHSGKFLNRFAQVLLLGIAVYLLFLLFQSAREKPSLFFSQVLNGLQLGFIYALIALGYTLIYGIVKLINFCHGDVVMVGAFTSFYAIATLSLHQWPLALFPAMNPSLGLLLGVISIILLSMTVSGFMSLLIDRFAYRPMRERSASGALIAAVGASMFLEYFAAQPFAFTNNFTIYVRPFEVKTLYAADFPSGIFPLVVTIFVVTLLLYAVFTILARRGSQKALALRRHPLMQTGLLFGGFMTLVLGMVNAGPLLGWEGWDLSVTNLMLIVMTSSILLQIILQYIVHRTRTGKAMRATAANKATARLMGINVNVIVTATFAVGGALAGAAGVLYTTAYPRLNYLMGALPGLKAFIAAVFGGIGSVPGAVVGGLIMGQVEILTAGFISTPMRDAISFSMLIIVLLFRPQGIFGEPPVEKL